MLRASPSGFYDRLERSPCKRIRDDQRLLGLIRTSFQASDRTYGSPRVHDDLRDWGERCSEKRVARLMRQAQLRARPKRRRPPLDLGIRLEHFIAPNLLDREFQATKPNQKWVADFTYIATGEGWLYLAVVLDLFSRRILGWSMQPTMTAQLVLDALLMALWRRGRPNELLHHLRPGQSVHERGLPAAARGPGDHLQHEPQGRRVGQRGNGELVLEPEAGTGEPSSVSVARRGTSRSLRLH